MFRRKLLLVVESMDGDQEECLQAGMNDYISKPVKLEDLVATTERWSLRSMGNYEAPTG